MFSIFFITAVTADHYYCFKKTPGLAKGLIYGTSICYEVTLKSTDEYTFTWNNPERKHIIPNNISDFGVGCADLKEYMNGGDCWGAVETNVNCGIIHGRLEYWNSVLPVSNYVKTFLDYFHVAEKATRMFPTMPRSLCKNITGGIECSAGQKGIIQWFLNGTDSAIVNVDMTKDYVDVSSFYIARDHINKLRGLYTFFFHVRNRNFRTADEMIQYGSTILPMEDLCKKCTASKCGTMEAI